MTERPTSTAVKCQDLYKKFAMIILIALFASQISRDSELDDTFCRIETQRKAIFISCISTVLLFISLV